MTTLVSKRKDISSEVPSDSSFGVCLKNGRLRGVVELKQAFGGENELLDDTLDSDFNEESFENLLDAEDEFQHDLKSSTNCKFIFELITLNLLEPRLKISI